MAWAEWARQSFRDGDVIEWLDIGNGHSHLRHDVDSPICHDEVSMANSSKHGSLVVLVVSLSLSCSAALAAQIRLGTIQEIKPISQSVCPDSTVAGDLFVSLQRANEIRPSGANPPQSLFLNTTVVVGRGNDARLSIDNPAYGAGRMILAPLLPCPGWAGWKEWTTVQAVSRDVGVYRLSPLSDSAGRPREGLELRVVRGGAYIEWDNTLKRQLIVYGGKGPYMKAIGTEFVVAVDSTHGTLLYVKRGAVGFEGSTVVAMAGQVYAVLPGGPQQIFSLGQSTMGQLQTDVDYHTGELWQSTPPNVGRTGSGPSWGKIVGGAVLVGGAAYGVYQLVKPKPSTQGNGTVIVRIPI